MPGEMGQMFDTPLATIWEDTEGYQVEMDLPGVNTEDLEVTMET